MNGLPIGMMMQGRRNARVAIPAGGGGASFGAGPNAPAWSGKTIHPDERFESDLTTTTNAAGFRAFHGFGAGFPEGGSRIEYPTVSTPLGTKRVMRMNFRGQTETLSALNATSTPYGYGDYQFVAITVYIIGTWVGQVAFESSADGLTGWTPVVGTVETSDTNIHVAGSSTTVNGLWRFENAGGGGNRFFRARFSSYTSGSATVRVGVAGGGSPAAFLAGYFPANPTRWYRRELLYISPNWTDGGNTGTKGLFFMQDQGNNHYMFHSRDGLALQPNRTGPYGRVIAMETYGVWLDTEAIITAGTAGGANGSAEVWVNGIKVIDATGIEFFAAGTTPRITDIYVNPTYGGGARPAPFNMYMDHAYVYNETAP